MAFQESSVSLDTIPTIPLLQRQARPGFLAPS